MTHLLEAINNIFIMKFLNQILETQNSGHSHETGCLNYGKRTPEVFYFLSICCYYFGRYFYFINFFY